MKLAASNVDLREEGAGVTVAFVPAKQHTAVRVHKADSLSNFSSGFLVFEIPQTKHPNIINRSKGMAKCCCWQVQQHLQCHLIK